MSSGLLWPAPGTGRATGSSASLSYLSPLQIVVLPVWISSVTDTPHSSSSSVPVRLPLYPQPYPRGVVLWVPLRLYTSQCTPFFTQTSRHLRVPRRVLRRQYTESSCLSRPDPALSCVLGRLTQDRERNRTNQTSRRPLYVDLTGFPWPENRQGVGRESRQRGKVGTGVVRTGLWVYRRGVERSRNESQGTHTTNFSVARGGRPDRESLKKRTK